MKEDKPSLAEKVASYLEASPAHGITDDAVLEWVGEAFPTDKPPEPEVVVKHVVPPGFVPADGDVLEYQRLQRDPNWDLVRERMRATLTPEEQDLADNEHAHFNWHYKANAEALRQEFEERQARAKELLDKVERSKEYYRSRMQSKDPAVRQQAEVDYFLKHVKA